jgi:hypothetical protein
MIIIIVINVNDSTAICWALALDFGSVLQRVGRIHWKGN